MADLIPPPPERLPGEEFMRGILRWSLYGIILLAVILVGVAIANLFKRERTDAEKVGPLPVACPAGHAGFRTRMLVYDEEYPYSSKQQAMLDSGEAREEVWLYDDNAPLYELACNECSFAYNPEYLYWHREVETTEEIAAFHWPADELMAWPMDKDSGHASGNQIYKDRDLLYQYMHFHPAEKQPVPAADARARIEEMLQRRQVTWKYDAYQGSYQWSENQIDHSIVLDVDEQDRFESIFVTSQHPSYETLESDRDAYLENNKPEYVTYTPPLMVRLEQFCEDLIYE